MVVVALYLIGLGGGIGNGDEAIYAEMVRAMHRSGAYLTLEYQGVELLQRPPTTVAMYAMVSKLVPGEFGLRLLPALLSCGTYVLLGMWLARRTGRIDAAVTAVLLGAAIPSVFVYGRLAFSDPPFVIACAVALVATVDAQRDVRWLPWAAAGLGAAFAFKSLAAGVVAVALVPWLLAAWWAQRDNARAKRSLLIALGVGVALAAPYYIAGFVEHGGAFWEQHIERILFARAAGDLEQVIGIGGPSAYFTHLWRADTAPVALVLGAAVLACSALAWRRRDRRLAVIATYAIVVFAVLSLAGTRLPHYLLVFYPSAVLAAGLLLAEVGAEHGHRSRALPLLGPVIALALLGTTLASDPFDAATIPSAEAKALGQAARGHVSEDQTVYTLDWYAPALGYYADRRWHMLVTPPKLARALGSIDPFRYTGTIEGVPPWPGGELIIATHRQRIDDRLEVIETLATHDDYVLVRAKAR